MIDKAVVEEIKRANPIEQVIGETPGWTVTGHGRYLSTREHPSMSIDTHNQYFNRFSQTDEKGDVIKWLKIRNSWDFRSAIEFLCRRAGIAVPDWGKDTPEERAAYLEREEIFDIAVSVFEKELWNNPAALRYARSRGWTDETIHSAQLGYTGDFGDRPRMTKALHDAIVLDGGDPRSVAGVAMVGFQGDVKRWLHEHDLDDHPGWIEQGYIPGFVGRDLLVYPHFRYGHCVYFSGRYIKDHFTKDGEKLKKSINLASVLVGQKQVYFNWQCSPKEKQIVFVEGQADAITLGQWGYPAIALLGVSVDERFAKSLGAGDDRKMMVFYLALDADDAGALATNKIADLFGPMTRILQWKGVGGVDTFIDPVDGKEKDVKDANDLLRGMQK